MLICLSVLIVEHCVFLEVIETTLYAFIVKVIANLF
jgi:hypothetical protein